MQKVVVYYLEILCNVFFLKLVGLGCDGVLNMIGYQNGFIVLFQKEQLFVIVVYCFVYRLELVFKDVLKFNSFYEKVVVILLMGLYYFYYKSTVNRFMFKRCFNFFQRKVRIFIRVGGIRWVGYLYRVLESVIFLYFVIIFYF